jgi:hypothetical protein
MSNGEIGRREARKGGRSNPTLAYCRRSLVDWRIAFTVLPGMSGCVSARAMERPSLSVLFSFGGNIEKEGRGVNTKLGPIEETYPLSLLGSPYVKFRISDIEC